MATVSRRAIAWLLTFCAVLWSMPRAFGLDDAYIALHSARVVLTGFDPIYHVSGLTGATSPAYVALIAGLIILRVPPLTALWVANALGAMAFVAGLWMLAGAVGLPAVKRLVVVGVTVSAGYVWTQATNGLETGWAMAAIVWLLVCVRRGHVLRAGVLAGFVPSLRPDLLPAAGLLFLVAVWQEPRWERRAYAILLACAIALPFVIWVKHDTGRWFPDTMRAKMLYFADGCLPMGQKLRHVLSGMGFAVLLILPLSAGLVALAWSAMGRIGLLAIGISLTAYLLFFPDGVWQQWFRYLTAILVPWCALGMSELLAKRGRAVAIAVTVVGALGIPIAKASPRADAADLLASTAAVDRFVPADETILIQDAGAISEFAHRRAVDFVGLKTPSSIDDHARDTWPSCGRDRTRAIATIARRARATYVLITTPWNNAFRLTDGLRAEGLALAPVWIQPLRDHGAGYGYQLYRIDETQR